MNDWEKAIEEGKVIKISHDKERAESLIASSLRLLKVVEKLELNKENGFFILTNYYDVVLESLHALLYKKGYKALDHLSIGYYIRDILNKPEFFNTTEFHQSLIGGMHAKIIDFRCPENAKHFHEVVLENHQ